MLLICQMCNKEIGGSFSTHTCNKDDILAYVTILKEEGMAADNKLRQIQNNVSRLLEDVARSRITPPEEGEHILVEARWVYNLWQATQNQWHDSADPTIFIPRIIALQFLMSDAFRLFRSKDKLSLLEKLKNLKERCLHARDIFGYKESSLDLTPEAVLENHSRAKS